MAQEESRPLGLLNDFPAVSRAEWEEVIHQDLKGADYDRKLVWRTLEGFNVQPYYRAEDLKTLSHTNVAPGAYPYVRGNHPTRNPWLIRQDIRVEDYAAANSLARDYVARGATSIGFNLCGCELPGPEDLEVLLAGLPPEEVEINLLSEGKGDHLFDPLAQAFGAGKLPVFRGSISFGQLSWLLQKGRLCPSHGGVWERARMAMAFHRDFPTIRTLSVRGIDMHNAGASAVQELAFTLAMAAEYLTELTERGEEAASIAGNLRFNFAVGSTYFLEMAKLRAARLLWTRIVESFGVNDTEAMKMEAHVETSRWNMTVYDPHVNLLRASTEAMSAVLGGVHSLNILPFDAPYAEQNELSSRLSRNAQLLLRDESYFDRVVDPAGGSYYIETLTHSVAKAAWDLFLEVQREGGFLAAARSGLIDGQIRRVAQTRRDRIASRRDSLLGTNQFPNFGERLPSEVLDRLSRAEVTCSCGCNSNDGQEYMRLSPFRGGEELEALRLATDRSPRHPVAFMLALGNLAMRRARAQFSCNFLACAGFEVIDNIGFASVDEGLKAARKAGSDLIVLCSSDEEYAELAPEVLRALQKGEILLIAGAPACQPELEAQGIKHFINVKSNLLETLRELQHLLGIGVQKQGKE